MDETLRIGLLWHSYGHGNLGVDALSRSNVAILRSACASAGVRPEFILFGPEIDGIPLESGVTQAPRMRMKEIVLGKSPWLDLLASCDLVLDSSEGDSFTDIYGFRRFFYHAVTKVLALAKGRKLVLSPQTIGPFNTRRARAVAGSIARRATMVFPRDDLSNKALAELGAQKRAREVTDVAFRLPFERERPSEETTRIGINVSGLMYDEHKTSHAADFSLDFRAYVHSLIENFMRRGDTEIWLVPHVVGGASDDPNDVTAAKEVAAKYPDVKIAPTFRSSVEAKSFISGLDFFVGGRMHACIAAFSSKVPVVPIAYSRKFVGLFGTLGYHRVVDAKSVSLEQAMDATLAAYDARKNIPAEIDPCLAMANERLAIYEDSLAELCSEIAENRNGAKEVSDD